ncbi:ATP-binding protein [Streptomyces sp. NPDC087294]|uniref:ATP-binding protein n=1 Tax=Streptomyces sp. NPDC087294 TaxID=3365777 RepID=UPI00382599F4
MTDPIKDQLEVADWQPLSENGLVASWVLSGVDLGTPRAARALVMAVCCMWRVGRELRRDVEIVTSELVTNAVLHARRPEVEEAVVTVTVQLTAHDLWLAVVDQGADAGGLARREPAHDEPGGRGLLLVEALTTRCEVVSGVGGTRVRVGFALPHRREDDGPVEVADVP